MAGAAVNGGAGAAVNGGAVAGVDAGVEVKNNDGGDLPAPPADSSSTIVG